MRILRPIANATIHESLLKRDSDPTVRQARSEAIRGNPVPTRRLAAIAVHELTSASSLLSASVSQSHIRKFEELGFEYVGSGASATVLRRGKEIMKVERSTGSMDDDQRLSRLHRTVDLVDGLHRSYPDTTIETRVGQLAINGDKYVVLFQDYVDGKCAVFPKPHRLAREFAEEIMDKQTSDTTILPDLLGYKNLIVEEASGNLRLIDTVPTSKKTNPIGYARNIDRIKSLASGKDIR